MCRPQEHDLFNLDTHATISNFHSAATKQISKRLGWTYNWPKSVACNAVIVCVNRTGHPVQQELLRGREKGTASPKFRSTVDLLS